MEIVRGNCPRWELSGGWGGGGELPGEYFVWGGGGGGEWPRMHFGWGAMVRGRFSLKVSEDLFYRTPPFIFVVNRLCTVFLR